MNRLIVSLFVVSCISGSCINLFAQNKLYPNEFPLEDVTLLDGPFMHARDLNIQVLLKMEYMLSELIDCQDANAINNSDWGVGYAGGVPNSKNIWSAFKSGDFSIYNSAWAPFYNLHKMFAGLRDAWLYCGNESAKALFLKFCDWGISITSALTDEQMQSMLNMEHGGMNEIFADA